MSFTPVMDIFAFAFIASDRLNYGAVKETKTTTVTYIKLNSMLNALNYMKLSETYFLSILYI